MNVTKASGSHVYIIPNLRCLWIKGMAVWTELLSNFYKKVTFSYKNDTQLTKTQFNFLCLCSVWTQISWPCWLKLQSVLLSENKCSFITETLIYEPTSRHHVCIWWLFTKKLTGTLKWRWRWCTTNDLPVWITHRGQNMQIISTKSNCQTIS